MNSEVKEELDQLERSIRRLQIEWEKFFGGVERKPPQELKTKVEQVLRKYATQEIRNNTERFRYQSLQARYNTFSDLWSKRLRALEEGRPVGMHGWRLTQVPAPPAAPPPPPPSAGARAAATAADSMYRVRSADSDVDTVRALYDRFLEARKQAGEAGGVKFESFRKIIDQQASRILSEKGAAAVDFRLETKDGKVSLKAKPVRA